MTHGRASRRGWISQLLFALSLGFLGFGLFNLAWVVWPTPTDAVQLTIPEGVLPGATSGTTYASLADYALTVSWPVWLRQGESDRIHVRLIESENDDIPPEPNREAQVLLVEPSLIALPIDPPGRVQTNLAAGQGLDLAWEVTGSQVGEFPGQVLVSFGFFDSTLAELVQVPIAIVDMTVRVNALWGLGSNMVMWFGVVSLIFWGTLFLIGRVVQIR